MNVNKSFFENSPKADVTEAEVNAAFKYIVCLEERLEKKEEEIEQLQQQLKKQKQEMGDMIAKQQRIISDLRKAAYAR